MGINNEIKATVAGGEGEDNTEGVIFSYYGWIEDTPNETGPIIILGPKAGRTRSRSGWAKVAVEPRIKKRCSAWEEESPLVKPCPLS